MNAFANFDVGLRSGEGNVEYEDTPDKAIDQTNYKVKQDQFTKLKSVMKK